MTLIGERVSYFTTEELQCKHCEELIVDKRLLISLNWVREQFGKPISVTSGYRCKRHNKAVGGKEGSAHTKGMAVDIKMPDNSLDRFSLLKLLFMRFHRIGFSKDFIHVDIDDTKDQEVLWLY